MTTEAERREALRREMLRAKQEAARLGFEEPAGGVSVSEDLQGGGPAFRRALANPFQLGDEIAGVIGAIDPDSSYQMSRDEARWLLATDRRDNRAASMLGQVFGDFVAGGAIAGPIDDGIRAIAPALRGGGLLARIGRGALAGSAEGTAYGFAEGEGFDDRFTQALTYGALGGVTGAALPVMGEAVNRLALRPAAGTMNVGNQQRAANRVIRAMEEAGMTPDEISARLRQAADDGQDIFTVADVMGRPGRNALAGVTTQPGAGRALAEEALDARSTNNTARLREYVMEAMNAGDATAAQDRARLVTSRADDAAMNYGAARDAAGPVNVNDAVGRIDELLGQNPLLGEGSDLAQSSLGRRLQSFRDRLATSNSQLIDFDEVMRLRTDLRLWREQNPRAASMTNGVYEALTDALSDASPDFRSANDAYRQASRVIDVADQGQRASQPSVRFADVQSQADALRTPEERDAFRLAFANRDLARVENATGNSNPARTIFGGENPSIRAREVYGTLADDPDLLFRRVAREDTMQRTSERALGGSPTAANLAEQAAANSEDVSILQSLLTNNPTAAAGQALGRAYQAVQGMNEATREAISRALLSRDGKELQRLLEVQQRNEATNRIIGGLFRGALREPTAQGMDAIAR